MNLSNSKLVLLLVLCISISSCVGKKKFVSLQTELEAANADLGKCGEDLNNYMSKLTACENEAKNAQNQLKLREEQIKDLRSQITEEVLVILLQQEVVFTLLI